MASRFPILATALSRAGFRDFGLTLFLIAFTALYYLLNAKLLLGHYDLGWHLAAGDLIREQGKIPFTDPWSFTAGGTQWRNLSWLWDVLASVLFQRAHFTGLVLLVLACGAAIVGTLVSICRRSGASPAAVCMSVLAAALLYPAFAAFPNIYLAASPNMATMLFSVIFYGECLQRRTFLLPAIMLLWANLHGGFVLGIFITGVFCAVALLRRDWPGLKTYGMAAGGCVIAACFNPLGWHVYPAATTTVGNYIQTYITEWWPYYRNMTMPGSIPGILYILIFAALELRGGKTCPLEARLLSWLFLFLGIYQFRYLAFFFLFSTVPLALHLDRLLTMPGNFRIEKFLRGAGIAASCALPLIFAQMEPAFGFPPMLSEQDVQYLQSHYPHARLLNHWNMGGLLIFRMRGAVPIFVDGRAATAYPESLLRDYFPLAQPEVDESAWDTVLAKYNIDAVLWMKSHAALRQFLTGKRGWREAYAGEYASLYVRSRD